MEEAARRIGLRGDGWIEISVPELPWRVEVLVESVDGVAQILGLRLEPDVDEGGLLRSHWIVRDVVITSARLRSLPLRRLRQASSAIKRMSLVEAFGALRPPPRKPGQRLMNGHYEAVADLYRAAIESGDAPLPAIGRRWQVSRPTASRWVRGARELGVLGWPSRPGVAGTDGRNSPVPRSQRGRPLRG